MACEVFLEGSNDPALLFHGSFGFHEVGQHMMTEADVRAAMLMKPLCSYALGARDLRRCPAAGAVDHPPARHPRATR